MRVNENCAECLWKRQSALTDNQNYLSEIRGWNRRVENARDSMPKPTYYVGEGKQVSKTAFFHMSEEEEYGSDWYYYKD